MCGVVVVWCSAVLGDDVETVDSVDGTRPVHETQRFYHYCGVHTATLHCDIII